MKVLLVKPPERSRFNFGSFSLAVLAAYVRDLVKISIFDATHYNVAQATSVMLSKKYDLIGITVMSPSSVKNASTLIRSFRRMLKQNERAVPPIICGGHGASMYPYPLLAAGADRVVFGQGEQPFRSLLLNTAAEVPGTIRLDKKNLIRIPVSEIIPPEQLPLPARDLISIPSDNVHLMETSRGCPHRCSFCETSRFYAHIWKAFQTARITSEVTKLVEQYSAWMILIADDNFAASTARILELCPMLAKGTLPLFFMASARIDDLSADSRILPALAAARIARITVGIETIDEECGKRIGKGYSFALCRDTIMTMRKLGMYTVASFILGLPGETDRLKERMLDAAVEIGADSVAFVPFHPLPQGTERTCADILLPGRADEIMARKMTLAFHSHPKVIARREEAIHEDSLRGIITRAAMKV